MARARPRFTVKSEKKETKPDPARERAWRAVRKFNQMTSTLTGFARALTGDQRVVVRAGKITSTDGRFINIVPPLALGDEIAHERGTCNDRGNDGQQLCPACNLGEKVMRRIYHEMAHITGKTMQAPASHVRAELYALVDEWHPEDACSHGRAIKANINNSGSYIAATRAIHPYCEMIIAALEDARIDGRMIRVRPGLRRSFYAATYDTFVNGVESPNGELKYWRDAPFTSQVIIGFTLKGANYLIDDDWLAPEVQDILEVPELRNLVMAATGGPDVHETALKTIDMFRLLHRMGLLDADKCEVPPPSLNKPGDDGEDSDKPTEPEPAEQESTEPEPADPESDSTDGSGEDASQADSQDGDADSDGDGDDSSESEEEVADADEPSGADDDSTGDGAPGDTASGETDGEFDNDESALGDEVAEESGESDESDSNESEPDGAGDSGEEGQSSDGPADGGDEPQGHQGNDGEQSVQEDDSEADAEPADETGAEDHPEDDSEAGDEGVDEDGDDFEGPVGEGVWDEEVPEAKTSDTYSHVNPGTLSEVQEALEMFHPHQAYEGADEDLGIEEEESDEEDSHSSAASPVVEQALTQSEYFDRASQEVGGVDVCQFPLPEMGWVDDYRIKAEDFMPSEAVIGKALMQGRLVFAANKRSRNEVNLTSGKINGRMLGKRAPFNDERMFRQRQLPGKRDYVVAITVDCSGSTSMSYRMERIKRAVFAKAELLNRLGIKFYITGHTGWYSSALKGGRNSVYNSDFDGSDMTNLWILNIKGVDEAWNDETRRRLANLQPMAENYDGHTLEYHRKELERRTETDKILIYYTDGAMPAANYDEELTILTEEIQTCKKKNITLMAVGINTSSPAAHGFDTVRVDSDEDLDKVVSQLKRRLLG